MIQGDELNIENHIRKKCFVSEPTERNINIEILRIVSMMMIITEHALTHSNIMDVATGSLQVVLIIVEIITIPAVNVYVLISGYFLIDAKWNFKRIFCLWFQVFFYSILIYTVAITMGITKFSFTSFLEAILPISGNQYWFARVFMCFSLIAPFVAILLNTLTKKQYQFLIVIMLIIFSLWKSFLPFSITVNPEGGNSIIWFFVLFAISGYIRLHVNNRHKESFWIISFVISTLITILSFFVLRFISFRLGFNGRGMSLFTTYTSVTVIGMSISLFMFFITKEKIVFSKKLSKSILFFSSSTYSVYLIHDNQYIRRWLWSKFNPADWIARPWFSARLFTLILSVFLISTMLDFITWKWIGKLIRRLDFNFVQNKINQYLK